MIQTIIDDSFHPSVMEMNSCAEILKRGLQDRNSNYFYDSDKQEKLIESLREYINAFKSYKSGVFNDIINELESK